MIQAKKAYFQINFLKKNKICIRSQNQMIKIKICYQVRMQKEGLHKKSRRQNFLSINPISLQKILKGNNI